MAFDQQIEKVERRANRIVASFGNLATAMTTSSVQ
jgi:hypothetical protein